MIMRLLATVFAMTIASRLSSALIDCPQYTTCIDCLSSGDSSCNKWTGGECWEDCIPGSSCYGLTVGDDRTAEEICQAGDENQADSLPTTPSLRSFADVLSKVLYSNENDCFSSWGISMMLDLVRPGVGQVPNTSKQLCDVVGLCGPDDQLLWAEVANELTSRLDGGDCIEWTTLPNGQRICIDGNPKTLLKIANSLWIDLSTAVRSDYGNLLGDFIRREDFQSTEAGKVVNSWVNETTNGLIESIMEDGPILYDLVAINTIYLDAPWQFPFMDVRTTTDLFRINQTTTIDAHFMHMVSSNFFYSHSLLEDFQILRLPYRDGLSMILVLPLIREFGEWDQDQDTIALRNLGSEDIFSKLPDFNNMTSDSQDVAVALPKFKFESKYEDDLEAALKAVGLEAPFDASQGFCEIFDGSCAYIDKIVQKTSIEVNEDGTIAAAATAGSIMKTSIVMYDSPVLVQFDRPFKFFIHDAMEDIILFEGIVGAANIPDRSVAKSDQSHASETFWTDNFDTGPVVPVFKKRFVPPKKARPAEDNDKDSAKLYEQGNRIRGQVKGGGRILKGQSTKK